MADPLIRFLSSRIVLISDNNSVGTGFFIAQNHILTCAHVVRDAAANQSPIYVEYHTFDEKGDDQFIRQQIDKIMLTALKEGEEYPDVAILEMKVNFTHGIFLLPEIKDEILYARDVEYIAFGYQKQSPHSGQNIPQSVSLNYEGEEGARKNRKIIFENGLIRPGMSGAPLVERLGARVTGLVHMTRDDVADLGAYTIPMEEVLKAIRGLDEKLFSTLQSKDHRKAVLKTYRKDYPQFPLIQKYWKNLVVLSLVLFCALFWFFTHIGTLQKSYWLAAFLVIIPLSLKLFGDWLGTEVDSARNKVKNRTAAFIFNWWFLIITSFIVGSLWLFVTSVWIEGNPEDPNLKLTLYKDKKLHSEKNLDGSHQAYFLVPMFPFTKEIILKPENHEQVFITIQTGKRNKLYYPFNFQLEPVIFLRFDNDNIDFAKFNSYILEIMSLKNNLKENYDTLLATGALWFGNRDVEITQDLLDEWRKTLPTSANLNKQQEILNILSNGQHLSRLDLNKGDSIQIILINKVDLIENKPDTILYFRKKILINPGINNVLVIPYDTL